MVHTTLTAQLHSGIRTRKYSNRSLYNVVVNGENGEYYEWEVEAESYGEASSKGEESEDILDEKMKMVEMALAKMAVKCRKLLWSFYADELSWATIAGLFGMKNADSAKSSASRCRQRFKELFNEVKKEKYGK